MALGHHRASLPAAGVALLGVKTRQRPSLHLKNFLRKGKRHFALGKRCSLVGFSLQQQQKKPVQLCKTRGRSGAAPSGTKTIPPPPGHTSPPALLPLLSASVSALAQSMKQLQKAPGNPWAGSLTPEQGGATPEKPLEQRGRGTGGSSTALSPCPPSSSVLGRTKLQPGTALGWMGTGTEEWEQKCHKPMAGGQAGDMGI